MIAQCNYPVDGALGVEREPYNFPKTLNDGWKNCQTLNFGRVVCYIYLVDVDTQITRLENASHDAPTSTTIYHEFNPKLLGSHEFF